MSASAAPEEQKAWSASLNQQPSQVLNSNKDEAPAEPLDRPGSNDDPNSSGPSHETVVEEAEDLQIDEDPRTDLNRTQTNRTDASVSSAALSHVATSTTPPARSFLNVINPLKSRRLPPIPVDRQVSREHTAGFFSRLTFQWIAPLMHVGYQRTLELNDVWLVNPDRSVDVLAENLAKNFRARVDRGADSPLRGALYDTLKVEFLLGGFCELIASICTAVNPFVLRYVIQFAEDAYLASHAGAPAPAVGRGVGLIVGVTCINIVQSLCTHHFLYNGMTCGGQARAALITLIFDKAMTVSSRARAGYSPAKEIPDHIKHGSEEERSWLQRHLPLSKKKVQPLAKDDNSSWDNGRIINLMSVDTSRVELASGFFHMSWTAPIIVVIVLIFLLINLTYSALAGFGLLLISTPLLGRAVKSLMIRRKAINKITDERVSLTTEILHAVKFVKFFAAEVNFLERLNQIRKREINRIQVILTIRNAIMAVGMSMPVFASMLAFITYSLTHHGLSPASIFSSLALFNALRLPLNLLPVVIGQIVDGAASLRRIQEFLLLEDAKDAAEYDNENADAVTVTNSTFVWEKTPVRSGPADAKKKSDVKKPSKSEESRANVKGGLASNFPRRAKPSQDTGGDAEKNPSSMLEVDKGSSSPPGSSSASTLAAEASEKPHNTSAADNEEVPFGISIQDLHIGRHELIAVIGKVGCGKSSLLSALAGDMRRTQGKVVLGASRAFCPQVPWILNATVKGNVIFGREFRKRWYNDVIDACALRADLEMLPARDETEIGEKGITISGGQKQRLNLARAIYFDADIILMDDPLSAVDAHVGRHIMDNAICGLLADKCRILATHQLHVLHRCDRIIWMDEGRIKTIDTFDNLMANSKDFQQMLASTSSSEAALPTTVDDADETAEVKRDGKKRSKGKKQVALMQEEERATKSVAWTIYANYLKASGSSLAGPLVLTLLIISQGATIVTSLWLSFWTSNKFGYSTGIYIGIYAVLGFVQAVLTFCFSSSVTIIGTRASQTMLHRAVYRVLRAPMSFFDTTPNGRITNRFSKDIDTMDNVLTDSYRMFLMTSANIIAVLILIVAYFYYFVIALVPLVLLFVLATNYYRASAREMKRHEAVLRSSVYSRFGEAITGVSTIRAYGLQNHFSRTVREAIDSFNGPNFLTYSNQRWLGIRLDAIGSLLVFVTGILVVTSRFTINPSTSGLVLSYILSIVQFLQFSVRQLAEVENNMNATERLNYYGTQLEEEAPLHTIPVDPAWPATGEIVFSDVEMRYRAGLPLVLKCLSLHVQGGERIGFVGRTGAGKSSIMTTLFRLTELSGGSIEIDGLNIAKLGLADLRSRLGIIPQDPTLFKGTIRYNLDPFDQHTDLELWNALRQADLINEDQTIDDRGSNIRIHLDTPVEDEGLNFSTGQRQLLALARALVAGTRILVCDEATSSVDAETDKKIQTTILKSCQGKTLLCIAHRLKTILGYDRICVMDSGQIAEVDSPRNLYMRTGSVFRGMCEASGISLQTIDDAAAERVEIERVKTGELYYSSSTD